MKKYIFILLTAAACVAGSQFTAYASPASNTSVPAMAKPKKDIKTVVFSANLHCKACVNKVMDNVAFEKGVKDLKVDLEKHTITIKYDAAKTNPEKLAAAIEKLGYKAKVAE